MSILFGLTIFSLVIIILQISAMPEQSQLSRQKSKADSKKKQIKKTEKLFKVLSWCENKYRVNIACFKDGVPSGASEMLIYAIANAGAALYLRTCGVRVLKNGVEFSSTKPSDIVRVITNDRFLLFLLGEEMKEFELYPSGKHKNKAVEHYRSHLGEHGPIKSWEALKVDIHSFIQQILTEKASKGVMTGETI